MTPVAVALLVVFLAGAGAGIYALAAPRRRVAAERQNAARAAEPPRSAPVPVNTSDWTNAAGEEFAGLPETARCEMIFAVAALDDERSQRLLERALGDPSEAVALAAAHVLVGRDCQSTVESYLASHPGERAERIAKTLSLLDGFSTNAG